MAKRIPAILLALCMLFSAAFCFAAGPDDEDGDEDFESTQNSGFEEEDQKNDFKSVSTYNIKTSVMKDFVYKLTDDGKAAILTSYTGEDRDVTFPAEVENGIPVIRIDDGMCSDNPVIVNLRIPGSIKRIGNAAFSRCPNLRSVVIEEGVEIIGMCSFGGCAELVEIQLPDSLTEVDNCVFAFCPELKEVTFGSRMTRIGAQAFYGCENLVRITVPGGSQVTFGDRMFEQCPNEVEIIY